MMFVIMRIVVDLPAPLGPSSPKDFPIANVERNAVDRVYAFANRF